MNAQHPSARAARAPNAEPAEAGTPCGDTPARRHAGSGFHKRSVVEFPEGWRMTYAQRRWYWSMVQQLAELEKWSGGEMEQKRRDFHVAAGLGPVSAKAINHTDEFDSIIGEWLARTRPDDLEGQLRLIKMPLIRLRTRIKCMAPEAYRLVIMRDRFGKTDLNDLTETELTQLRNTLEARARASHRHDEVLAHGHNGEAELPPEEPF